MHIKPPSTAPYSIRQLRIDNPDTSFPESPSDELLAKWGVFPVITLTSPEYDAAMQYVVSADPVFIAGQWVQQWEVVDLPADDTQSAYTVALESHYDAVAQSRRYDNRLTCALRAGYPGPFQAEALAFAQWMDNCNATAYQYMLDVEAGELERPTIAGMLELVPDIVWT
jgi:hypothetical protein